LKFAVTAQPGALLKAVVDPEDTIAELYERNNSTTLATE
jgi:subtilase family serine protease